MTDGTVYRFITNHLGSVRLVVNAETGAVVQRMDYDAFGRLLNDTNPGFQPSYVGYVQAPGCYQGFEASAGAGFGFQVAAAGVSDTDFYGGGPWQ